MSNDTDAQPDAAGATDIALSNSLADLAARIRAEHEAAGRPRIWRSGTSMPKGWSVEGRLMSREEEDEMFGHMRAACRLLIEASSRLPSGDQWLLRCAKQCRISRRIADSYMELAWDRMPDDEAGEIERRTAAMSPGSPS